MGGSGRRPAMKLSLGVKVGTSLALTPQLQQAIRLLQLSSLELEQEVQNQLDSNPLLERMDEEFPSQSGEVTDTSYSQPLESHGSSTEQSSLTESGQPAEDDQRPLDAQMEITQLGDELPVDTQWDDVFSQQGTAGSPDDEEREQNLGGHETLAEVLRWQLSLARFSPVDTLIAYCLIDSIDDRGYVTESLAEILNAVQAQLSQLETTDASTQGQAINWQEEVGPEEVEVVLKRIQHFEPAGVAARDLRECLLLQLRALPSDTPYRDEASRVLEHHELLVNHELAKLLKMTRLTEGLLREALTLIKTLTPYPGLRYQASERDYQTPDVVVRRKGDRWEVLLNTDHLPRLRVNNFYAGMIRRADQSADNQYLKQNLQEARNFIKSIEERHKTLLKVASCIVLHQRAFLEHGPQAMKPLILRDIADEVELHESTVSRITTQKFLLTPRGLFELKYFFSSHVSTSTGGECSSTAIRAMIKQMVSAEDPRKPLSDNTIAERLKAEGIDVARRTIAKYRESLHIPSSSDRKRLI